MPNLVADSAAHLLSNARSLLDVLSEWPALSGGYDAISVADIPVALRLRIGHIIRSTGFF